MKQLYIYKYNEVGVLTELEPVHSLQEQQSYKVESEQGEMVFPSGVTDVAPPDDMAKYPGISPIYDETNRTWSEDELAVQEHLESIKENKPVSDKQRISDLESIISDLIMMNGGI